MSKSPFHVALTPRRLACHVMESITYFLAMIGYAGLASVVLLAGYGRWAGLFWRGIALVIPAHVALVWTYRYDWQWSQATRNGYAGFFIFHTALAIIMASIISPRRHAQLLARVAFPIVTIGALGASFRYEVVAMYRIPVIACAALGGWGLLRGWLAKMHDR